MRDVIDAIFLGSLELAIRVDDGASSGLQMAGIKYNWKPKRDIAEYLLT